MDEFIIDETYEQICINAEGNIEISGLSWEDVSNIRKDVESANMTTHGIVRLKKGPYSYCIDIVVEFNAVVLKDRQLLILLNPDEYPFEAIVINIK